MVRVIRHLSIQKRRNVERIAIASPRDFDCMRVGATGSGTALPYCFDFARARSLYVTGVAAARAQSAPFYYLFLRRHAQGVISVPVEHGPLRSQKAASEPVFMFSPGRCGSTMLSRVLSEAGIPSVSEPDFYTQLASVFWSSRFNVAARPFVRAMWSMSHDLSVELRGAPVVKLRAECARAPERFVRGPGARTLVMIRSFESWVRSTARVFGAGPDKAVRKYLTVLNCYSRLNRMSQCHILRYEEWTSDPVRAAAELGQFLGVTIPAEAVRRATGAHSQEGTPLEGRVRAGWEPKFDAAMELWQSPRLVSAREKLEIPSLWG